MPKVHSHYENLKVARNASQAAIRAAYRSLSQKYHPDRNPGNADAARIMAVINVAYGALSDPAKKREHDAWIAQAERGGASRRGPAATAGPFGINEQAAPVLWPRESKPRRRARLLEHLVRHGVVYTLAGFVLVAIFAVVPGPAPLGLIPYVSGGAVAPAPPPAQYQRAAEAPNGRPWPEQTGYVDGYERRNASGLSEVTIDNTGNNADMFAKLMSLDGPQAYPVRVVFVRAHTRFKLTDINSGTYDLRYRNLGDGRLSRSQFFTLEEVPTANGMRQSSVNLTLYETHNGNIQTYGLAEAEF